jgi:hypothetical protein
MKSNKFCVIVLGLVMFAGLLTANKPIDSRSGKFATEYVDKLSAGIQLTDSQKIKLRLQAINFVAKLDSIASIKSGSILTEERIILANQFEQAVDSILTPTQRTLIQQRINSTINAVTIINKSK